MSKRVLITGGAGFIGANFIHHYMANHPNDIVVNVDALTYAANIENLASVATKENYHFYRADITDAKAIATIFDKHDITDVIHFAAESHVDNSIKNPDLFVRTNVNGTFTLLDRAYKHWMDAPFICKKGYESSKFVHISTDEVFGSLGSEGYFTEESPYAPNSPYSASKAASDMMVRSYFHTYGLNINITNCSNNFGRFQHDEKLIPTIIRKALAHKPIPIYGDGNNIRDWLHVDNHCRAIEQVFLKAKAAESYVIGARNERSNNAIATKICTILDRVKPKHNGSYKEQITYVQDRPGHDRRYGIDPSKIEKELGFSTQSNFDKALEETIEYYIDKYEAKI